MPFAGLYRHLWSVATNLKNTAFQTRGRSVLAASATFPSASSCTSSAHAFSRVSSEKAPTGVFGDHEPPQSASLTPFRVDIVALDTIEILSNFGKDILLAFLLNCEVGF